MRIDSSGTVIVGGSAQAEATSVALNPQGYIYAKSSHQQAAFFDRDNSDGDIVTFRKQGAAVGSIGAYNGVPYIGYSGGAGGGIMFNGASIEPTALGSSRTSGANDIGSVTYRWRHIYLSGGVNFSANANAPGMSSEVLDDYEEGTWTPAFTFDIGGSGIVYGTRSGRYTKVGNAVTVSFILLVSSGVSTSDYWARLTGIPFNGNGTSHFTGRVRLNNTGAANFNLSVDGGTTSLLCFHSNGTSDYARGSDVVGQQLSGSFTYFTDA